MSKKIVEVKCLKHKYPDQTEVSACGLNFVINEGEKVALVGSNGSGKTTLILHLLGILEATEGSVSVFGINPHKNFSKISPKVGVVMQSVDDQLVGPTVYEDVGFSLSNYDYPKDKRKERIDKVITRLGIEKLKDKVIHYLSGGEKKKTALAGALALKPKLLILDEAFNEIDPDGLQKATELIDEYCKKEKMAIVMAVSNKEDIKYFDKIYLLEDGKITFSGSREEFEKLDIDNQFCIH